MRTVDVEIAGREYTIKALPIRQNREWRKKYEEPLQDVVKFVTEAAGYMDVEWEDERAMVSKLGGLMKDQLQIVAAHLLNSADLIVSACFDYSAVLREDRKFIEENGYDEEMVHVFIAILEVAFPFGPLVGVLRERGRQASSTEPSSADQSSGSGTTN